MRGGRGGGDGAEPTHAENERMDGLYKFERFLSNFSFAFYTHPFPANPPKRTKMAVNLNDKRALLKKLVPEVDFSISTSGITIRSDRLTTPRFVPFDTAGKCRQCRSDTAEIDFVVSTDGMNIFCSRMKEEKYIPFDTVTALPGYALFKVRSRGRVFNVAHEDETAPTAADDAEQLDHLHDNTQTSIRKFLRPKQAKKTKTAAAAASESAELIDLTTPDGRAEEEEQNRTPSDTQSIFTPPATLKSPPPKCTDSQQRQDELAIAADSVRMCIDFAGPPEPDSAKEMSQELAEKGGVEFAAFLDALAALTSFTKTGTTTTTTPTSAAATAPPTQITTEQVDLFEQSRAPDNWRADIQIELVNDPNGPLSGLLDMLSAVLVYLHTSPSAASTPSSISSVKSEIDAEGDWLMSQPPKKRVRVDDDEDSTED
jgi:hypothetical protein